MARFPYSVTKLAPRFKDIYDTVTKSLYDFNYPSRYADYRIKPIRKINQKLIIQEWENITRIVLSLANKATTNETFGYSIEFEHRHRARVNQKFGGHNCCGDFRKLIDKPDRDQRALMIEP